MELIWQFIIIAAILNCDTECNIRRNAEWKLCFGRATLKSLADEKHIWFYKY